MNDETKLNLFYGAILAIFMGVMCYPLYHLPVVIERADNIMLEKTGLEIQVVTINSPTFYIEYEEMSGFLEAIIENKADVIYSSRASYGTFYVVFNEDLTIGHRIYMRTVNNLKERTPEEE